MSSISSKFNHWHLHWQNTTRFRSLAAAWGVLSISAVSYLTATAVVGDPDEPCHLWYHQNNLCVSWKLYIRRRFELCFVRFLGGVGWNEVMPLGLVVVKNLTYISTTSITIVTMIIIDAEIQFLISTPIPKGTFQLILGWPGVRSDSSDFLILVSSNCSYGAAAAVQQLSC